MGTATPLCHGMTTSDVGVCQQTQPKRPNILANGTSPKLQDKDTLRPVTNEAQNGQSSAHHPYTTATTHTCIQTEYTPRNAK